MGYSIPHAEVKHGQMSAARRKADRDRKAIAGLTCYERLWPCEGRGP